jgi:hypothetical protein
LPRLFAASFTANFFILRVKFAAKLPQQFAATLPRLEIFCLTILPDLYRKTLPRFCRDFAAMQQGRGKFFFS